MRFALVCVAAVLLGALAGAPAARADSGFTAELWGEGEADPALASCAYGDGELSCWLSIKPARSCDSAGDPGQRYRWVTVSRQGRVTSKRICLFEFDPAYPEPLEAGEVFRAGGIRCDVRLVGSGLGRQPRLRCAASKHGFTLRVSGRFGRF